MGPCPPRREVLARADRAHAALVALIATLSDEEVVAHSEYFDELGSHYREHLPELELRQD